MLCLSFLCIETWPCYSTDHQCPVDECTASLHAYCRGACLQTSGRLANNTSRQTTVVVQIELSADTQSAAVVSNIITLFEAAQALNKIKLPRSQGGSSKGKKLLVRAATEGLPLRLCVGYAHTHNKHVMHHQDMHRLPSLTCTLCHCIRRCD